MFQVGELVDWGSHPNAKILDVYDGGKFYKVYAWGTHRIKTLIDRFLILFPEWMSVDFRKGL
jgi:hypothetical protein